MMRVPCGHSSLYALYEKGKDIRIVTSPMDAFQMAVMNPGRQIVFFGIGFETTAPLTAALIEAAESRGLRNISVLSAHKTMPQAIRSLFQEKSEVGALLCPGHVASVTGAASFDFIPDELGIPAAIAGFEADDVMAALLCLVQMVRSGTKKCVNAYPRAVTASGNRQAMRLLDQVFEPCGARWRGLGDIPGSGLRIRARYAGFDAARRFGLSAVLAEDPAGCICAWILRGVRSPADCPAYGKTCTPDTPLGACMVSSEGSCAISYRYGGESSA
jgi:hydrogenase expression/formation protein HypD